MLRIVDFHKNLRNLIGLTAQIVFYLTNPHWSPPNYWTHRKNHPNYFRIQKRKPDLLNNTLKKKNSFTWNLESIVFFICLTFYLLFSPNFWPSRISKCISWDSFSCSVSFCLDFHWIISFFSCLFTSKMCCVSGGWFFAFHYLIGWYHDDDEAL